MAKHINTFIGGLDADTNVNSYGNTTYPDALNLRIFSDKKGSSGTLTSISKEVEVFRISGEVIVGQTILGDNLVVFSKSPSLNCRIRVIPLEDLDSSLGDIKNLYVLVKKQFDFSDNLSIVARYETEKVQKVYWADKNNFIRSINIKEDPAVLSSRAVESFSIVRPVTLASPKFSQIVSGQLKTGVYQYAYCLYEENGVETVYSSAVRPIPISESNFLEANSLNFKGSDSGKTSTNGISIEIPAVDNRYTHCRVIRLYYATQEGIPEIDIIHEGLATSGMIVTDTGGVTLGTLILEDYRAIPNTFIPITLESKNDYLFAGNVKEEYFELDFDARAYRFDNYVKSHGGQHIRAYLWDRIPPTNDWWLASTSSQVYIDHADPNWDVPTKYTVNPYNLYGKYIPEGGEGKFQIDGTTLGGTGKYVTYKFTNTNTKPNSLYSEGGLVYYSTDYNNLSNPAHIQTKLGYQRGDVYRFGIVFYDKYGRQSDVKYVGDIKIPLGGEEGFWEFSEYGNMNNIGIEFKLTSAAISSLPSEVVGWQVVRAERTYQDARIKDSGYVKHMPKSKNNMYSFTPSFHPYTTDSNSSYDPYGPIEYITPETNYNKNNNINHPVVILSTASIWRGAEWYRTLSTTSNIFVETVKLAPPLTSPYISSNSTGNIQHVGLLKASKEDKKTVLNNFRIANVVQFDANIRGVKGTTLVLSYIFNIKNAPGEIRYLRRAVPGEPYGGYSEAAIKSTRYYPCSDVFTVNTTARAVYGGDCYLGIFEYNRVLFTDKEVKKELILYTAKTDSPPSNRYANIVYLPVETKINLEYTSNPKFSQLTGENPPSVVPGGGVFTGTHIHNVMWETKGVHTNGGGESYEQEYDLYTYNPVYSTMDKSKVFFIAPDNLEYESTIRNRIYRTQKKINGESSDTWSKFYHNNFLDVDTAYGALSNLKSFKNNLLFFQEKAIGVIPIEEREVVSSDAGHATTIGMGGVMERYDYISTSSGVRVDDSLNTSLVGTTDNAVYYIDTFNSTINRLGETVEFLSDIKGVKSLLPKKILTGGVVPNSKYKEVWFQIGDADYSFSFNEYTNTFVSRLDSTFTNGFSIGNDAFTTRVGSMYSQNIGATTGDWKLSLYLNPNNLVVNRFDSLTFGSINPTSVNSIPFSNILLGNRFQSSNTIPLNSSNIRHRFRNWIFNKLRDTQKERFYDSYLSVSITGTTPVEIHDVLSEYSAINTL